MPDNRPVHAASGCAAALASELDSPFGAEPFHAYYPSPAPRWLTTFWLLFFLVAFSTMAVSILRLR